MAEIEQIDRYVIRGVLGEGNMGRVYLAYDPKFNREVALKVIRDTMLGEEKVRQWFHREARAMAQLQHPGIVEVHDYSGIDTDVPYLVMERLHGHTLGAVAKALGVFPDAALCEVAIQLGQAMAHAHGQGLIHRDLKPDNVFVEPSGRLVVTDFGLARAQLNVDLGASLASNGTAVIGTPLFLAPETIHDPKNASPASDIYAVGIMLYFLATLEMPFMGDDPFQTLSRILGGTHRPVHELRRGLPRVLGDAIEQVFAMDRNARVKNGEELEALFSRVRQQVAPGVDTLDALCQFLKQKEEFNEFTVATAVRALVKEVSIATPIDVITGQQPLAQDTQITQVSPSFADTQIARLASDTQIAQVTTSQTRVVTAVPVKAHRPRRWLLPAAALACLVVLAAAAAGLGPLMSQARHTEHAAPTAPATAVPLPAPLDPPATPAPAPPPTAPEAEARRDSPPVKHEAPASPRKEPARPARVAVVEPQAPGTLRVNTGSVWADIFINGEKRGATPIKAVIELPPGKYSVRLVNPDYGAQEHKVTIVSGEVTPLKTALDKK